MQQSRSKSRFIVRAHDEASALSALSTLLASLEGHPDIELVDTIGPPGRPHTAVLAVWPEYASALEQRVRQLPQLIIEPDRPLSLSAQTASAQGQR